MDRSNRCHVTRRTDFELKYKTTNKIAEQDITFKIKKCKIIIQCI